MQLYNYSWDLCGVLSRECEEFIKVWHHALFFGNVCSSSGFALRMHVVLLW